MPLSAANITAIAHVRSILIEILLCCVCRCVIFCGLGNARVQRLSYSLTLEVIYRRRSAEGRDAGRNPVGRAAAGARAYRTAALEVTTCRVRGNDEEGPAFSRR